MIYQMVMGFAVIVYLMLAGLGIEFGAPIWFFFAAFPAAPALSFALIFSAMWLGIASDDRARAKRRSAAAARRAKGEAL